MRFPMEVSLDIGLLYRGEFLKVNVHAIIKFAGMSLFEIIITSVKFQRALLSAKF